MKRSEVRQILEAWEAEPGTMDEREFTKWSTGGWSSWNGWSAEREFCEFAGELARMVGGPVVETGVGQGFTTRRLADGLQDGGGGMLLCYESDDDLRGALCELPFFEDAAREIEMLRVPGPSANALSLAALTVLDSDVPRREEELILWANSAKDGALLLVHDCGNGHREGTIWMQLRHQIEVLGIKGAFLRNPRGGFLGIR